MTKWDKIFAASSVVFLLGVVVFLLGEHFVPGMVRVTLPAGALVMGISGIIAGVAGIVIVLTPPVRT